MDDKDERRRCLPDRSMLTGSVREEVTDGAGTDSEAGTAFMSKCAPRERRRIVKACSVMSQGESVEPTSRWQSVL